jgi:hypothetical protein
MVTILVITVDMKLRKAEVEWHLMVCFMKIFLLVHKLLEGEKHGCTGGYHTFPQKKKKKPTN